MALPCEHRSEPPVRRKSPSEGWSGPYWESCWSSTLPSCRLGAVVRGQMSWWRRGELGCTRGLIPGKLLILQCSEYAKYARFATPVYVELTLHYKAIPTAS